MKKKTYTKKHIIADLALRHELSMNTSQTIVDDFFDIIRGYLMENRHSTRIEIRNFGVLEVKPTKAKPKARNPKTNEVLFVPAHKKTRFKPGKILKDHLKKPI
ncbi:MAG: integration host factor subunit beta [Candidatus Marinimicrobia bacterium]|jgi:nucleoid DNA-binding protein|nr:integration host factor subunit beta [Candidatus Neomarinimicrobiota bacterium]MBT3496223.1 integration host factor subunit beta [Candidatus Neomarinimicrobiota bacterium]MBT3693071.1 integration host factor subunit beta [Candidatus Neomarinimicrobiota bacterium]MBT3732785.1 integration host factor subunit beta [Candidatus Neomarinimicrobiota bacterium]MBT4143935.1 integration host factor subunit beta [Candidatus Neomarinimicrobiota bacterium]